MKKRLCILLLFLLFLLLTLLPAFSEALVEGDVAITDTFCVEYGETYSSPEEVALYLYAFEELPSNYITKNEAKKLGWESSKGNLWDVAYGCAIGGDRFGNREGLLPDADQWYECDVNFDGGYRGGERILFSSDGLICYSGDHYNSYTLIYDGFWADGGNYCYGWEELK